MIYLLKEKATPSQVQEMLEQYENMIKIVIDVYKIDIPINGSLYPSRYAPANQRVLYMYEAPNDVQR